MDRSRHVPADVKTSEEEDEESQRVPGPSRVLTREEMDRLGGDRALVSDFRQAKLEKDAQRNWDLFYKRNTTNFFKDRHWTTREFDELQACRQVRKEALLLLLAF